MEGQKWKWSLDQWLEDKVWVKVPKEVATPHFFFVLGFGAATILFLLIGIISKI